MYLFAIFTGKRSKNFLRKGALIFLGVVFMLGVTVCPAFAFPTAPTGLVAEPSVSPDINIGWSAPTTGAPNSYRVYRSLTSITDENKLSAVILVNLSGSITSYVDKSGISGETYWYAAAAIDDDGEGLLSNSDDATVAGKENPHGTYMDTSNLCRDCHDAHNSVGSTVSFRRASEKEVCYTCHDGTGSDYNIRTGEGGFDEVTLGETTRISYHPVPNTNLELESPLNPISCCDCHTPHLDPTGRSRLLMAGGFDGGDEFCGYCHGPNPNWKGVNLIGGDHLSYIGEPHGHYLTTASYTPSQAATKINCLACHGYHGADIRPLIPSTVYSNPVISGGDSFSNNTFCQACHNSAIDGSAWGGLALYDNVKHGLTVAAHANLTWTAGAYENEYQGGYCLNCHNPHGTNYSPSLDTTYLESFTDYQKDYQNQLCYDCHVDSKVPASDYSYKGKDSYIVSGHGESMNSGNIWPTSADTGGGLWTGGAEPTQCVNCHNPHGKDRGDGAAYDFLLLRWAWDSTGNKSGEEYLCYGTSSGSSQSSGCHSVAYTYSNLGTGGFYGSDVSLNIWDLFNPTTEVTATAIASNA
ncbi:cytochrome c3 family protein, partial [Candidatus Oleimmundimicrobium sp.]|uniref:cytochrome c3 family protein n=1 Tax=Candidatus Oleimmundimicrobium sp. TaxID=3060597 RepID=UPI00271E0A9B